jgi:uncharacterized protein with NRDE domain
MCLILIALDVHRDYKLILAGNRDEFFDRPSAPVHFWEEAPQILAGRDLKDGGTWFGMTKNGRIAAVTNYRDPSSIKQNAPSRGWLLRDYLMGQDPPRQYLEKISRRAEQYNGFNVILGEQDLLYWFSNRGDGIHPIAKGIHGLSNHLLNTPWPKVIRGKQLLTTLLSKPNGPNPEDFFNMLSDSQRVDDKDLPQTGVPLEWERMLSSIFISSPTYGTRSSMILLIDRSNHVRFIERITPHGSEPPVISKFSFSIE